MRIGIIDVGTNTFNLLIAEVGNNKHFKILYKSKIPVKLGKGGINDRIITLEAFSRGIEAIRFHHLSLTEYKVDKIFAYATSAIRSASNGKDFVDYIKNNFGIEIQAISGEREAELIYSGVKYALHLNTEKVLIMDIGGGSTEFIIANNHKIFWKHSFDLGIARLLDLFNPSDPIKNNEIIIIESHLESQLHAMFQEISKFNITTLIGSSGSFDSFASLISIRTTHVKKDDDTSFFIDLHEFEKLYDEIIKSSFAERSNMDGLEAIRVEMIVLASVFVNFIIRKLNIKKMYQSEYAIKEGILFDVINQNLKLSTKKLCPKF